MKTDLKTMRLRYLILAYLVLILLFPACTPESEPVLAEAPVNMFSDSTMLRIHALQDERAAEEITTYFTSAEKKYREAAAMAMASLQDPAMIPFLAVLLDDPSMGVRRAASYALGQTYDSAALPLLAHALQQEDSVFVLRELLESTGKVLTQDSVDVLNVFEPSTAQEEEGLVWGMYRAGIRNVHDPEFVRRAVALLDTGKTYLTRLGAAHFLARSPNLDLENYARQIMARASAEPAPAVRMALASALARPDSRHSVEFLVTDMLADEDYRVRVNTLRALSAHPARNLQDTTYFFERLEDPEINVQVAAAEIISGMDDLDPIFLVQRAVQHDDARVSGLLFTAAVRNGEDYPDAVEVVKKEYEAAEDPYRKAYLLGALAYAPVAYDFIVTQMFAEVHPAISTAGISALATMRSLENFPETLKQPLADVLREVMKSGDIGLIYTGAQILSNNAYDFRERYEDLSFLYASREMLSLPKDNEALQVLNATIAYFEQADTVPETVNPYNHPIDWEYVKTIPQDLEVTIRTTKGPVTLRMQVESAPGSVSNFLQLATDGYYDNVAFHRVVPNFVVQGGCPRGDGFGGENYSIRSEFSDLRYQEGSVGMASAGKDTEGTQWFITHSPTPHLDGRYTIFAEVTDGMQVVHQLEVGDRIEKIDIPEF